MPIAFRDVSHVYTLDPKHTRTALSHIDLNLPQGKMIAVIGTTGSGKSTLVQHLNALLLPTSGEVEVDEYTLKHDTKMRFKPLRQKVGLVFQFPEYQLFEETVAKDIAFGPKNFGLDEQEIDRRVHDAIRAVGLDESFLQRNPLDLSGGQKRRVAIAGVLAMEPKVLVLDEPTAGLDPASAAAMMALFVRYQAQSNDHTVILVTHDMDNVLNYCDHVVVLHEGSLIYTGDTPSFFNSNETMEQAAVLPPACIVMRNALIQHGFTIDVDQVYTEAALAKAIAKEVKR